MLQQFHGTANLDELGGSMLGSDPRKMASTSRSPPKRGLRWKELAVTPTAVGHPRCSWSSFVRPQTRAVRPDKMNGVLPEMPWMLEDDRGAAWGKRGTKNAGHRPKHRNIHVDR